MRLYRKQPIDVYQLAADLAQWTYDTDTYGFMDCYDSMEQGTEAMLREIEEYGPGKYADIIRDQMAEIIEDGIEDMYNMGLAYSIVQRLEYLDRLEKTNGRRSWACGSL